MVAGLPFTSLDSILPRIFSIIAGHTTVALVPDHDLSSRSRARICL